MNVRYKRGALPRSVNIPFHSAFNADGSLVPCPAVATLNQHRSQVKVVVGSSRGKHANQVCCQSRCRESCVFCHLNSVSDETTEVYYRHGFRGVWWEYAAIIRIQLRFRFAFEITSSVRRGFKLYLLIPIPRFTKDATMLKNWCPSSRNSGCTCIWKFSKPFSYFWPCSLVIYSYTWTWFCRGRLFTLWFGIVLGLVTFARSTIRYSSTPLSLAIPLWCNERWFLGRNGKFCLAVGPVTRTAGILAYYMLA